MRRLHHLSPTAFLITLIVLFGGGFLLSIESVTLPASADDPTAAEYRQQTAEGTLAASTPDADEGEIVYFNDPRATATATRTPTPIIVGNFVWDDIDGDGRQDAGEPGLGGIKVQIWNSTLTTKFDQTQTNSSGIYQLIVPGPGNYRVRVVLENPIDSFTVKDKVVDDGEDDDDQKDSDINTVGTYAGYTNTLVFGASLISTVTIDAGIIRYRTPTPTRTPTPINVGDFIWDDLDGDGIQDGGEPGLANVKVQIWNAGLTIKYDQTKTNSNGNYLLRVPGPGQYRVRVFLNSPADAFSPKDQGDDQFDSDVFASGNSAGYTDILDFASNLISITTIDIGIMKYHAPTPTRTPTPALIGDLVWHDLDGDGLKDGGEPGLAGVTVQLWNSGKSTMIDSDVTNASGSYGVYTPGGAGTFYIKVILPDVNDSFSPMDQGANDLIDSDIYNNVGDLGWSAAINLASNTISNVSVDAGIIKFTTPDGADTLALYSATGNKFSLLESLVHNPPASAYDNFGSNAPITGKFVMGDWNNDGVETPGIYSAGVFRFASSNSSSATWTKIKMTSRTKVEPVAGRFNISFANDCFGFVDLKPKDGIAGFPLYYVCNLTTLNPTEYQVRLTPSIAEAGKYQFVAGDFNANNIDTMAARRGATFVWSDSTMISGTTIGLPNSMYFGDPYDGYGVAVAGDWDGNNYDSFGLFFDTGNGKGFFFWRNDTSPLNLPHFRQRIKNKAGISPQIESWQGPGGARSAESIQPLPPPDVLEMPAVAVTPTPMPAYLQLQDATLTPTMFVPEITATPTQTVPPTQEVAPVSPSNTPLPTYMPTATSAP